jgi:hypothetical protein
MKFTEDARGRIIEYIAYVVARIKYGFMKFIKNACGRIIEYIAYVVARIK